MCLDLSAKRPLMDMLDFNLYASGRLGQDEAASRAALAGDRELAGLAFKHFGVLY